jgi:hypothetical protein
MFAAGGPYFSPVWGLGVTVRVMEWFSCGAELGGARAPAVETSTGDPEIVSWAGPTVSFAPTPQLFFTLNAAFGITDESSDFLTQFVIGIHL